MADLFHRGLADWSERFTRKRVPDQSRAESIDMNLHFLNGAVQEGTIVGQRHWGSYLYFSTGSGLKG
jgi:hypothetical protein